MEVLVTGVEAIADLHEEKAPVCKNCGQRQHSTTAKVRGFLTDYGGLDKSEANHIYNLRSRVSHSAVISTENSRGGWVVCGRLIVIKMQGTR